MSPHYKLLFPAVFMMLTGAAHALVVNPDGTGIDPAIDVSSMNWAPGNTLLTPVGNASIFTHHMGDVFQRYLHASLNGFEDSNGVSVGGPGPDRWVYIAGYREQVVSTIGNSVVLETIGGATTSSDYISMQRRMPTQATARDMGLTLPTRTQCLYCLA